MANLTIEQLTALAKQAGFSDSQAGTMAAIAMAESSGRADVVNSIGATGLWQINEPVWVKQHPEWTTSWLQNPLNNARAAKAVFDAQGLNAWTVYTSGAYRHFVPSQSLVDQVLGDIAKWSLPGELLMGGGQAAASGVVGQILSLPSQVTDALAAMEAPLKALMWLLNPASWVRIIAGMFGVILAGFGLFALAKAV